MTAVPLRPRILDGHKKAPYFAERYEGHGPTSPKASAVAPAALWWTGLRARPFLADGTFTILRRLKNRETY